MMNLATILMRFGLMGYAVMWLCRPTSVWPRENDGRRQAATQMQGIPSYVQLTNWLLTPFEPRNEGMVPWEARQGIERMGTNALPILIGLVRQDDTNLVRAWGMAKTGFEVLGQSAAPAVSELTRCLSNSRASVRGAAADCLGAIGRGATSASPTLAAALSDSDPQVRRNAAVALVLVPGKADLVVPALVSFLEAPHPDTNWGEFEQVTAIAALQMNYVSNATLAVGGLRRLTNSTSSIVKFRAEGLLSAIERPKSVPPLDPFLCRDAGR